MTILDIEQMIVTDKTDHEDEELEHWICPVCYPGFVENRKVKALCGLTVDDVPEDSAPPSDAKYTNCVVCVNVKCKQCGYRYYE